MTTAMKLSAVLFTTAALGACATSAPPPRYEPAPPRYAQPESQRMSLHDRVHDALAQQMGRAASGISVRVAGSEVHLSGHVGSQADHNRAHDVAHRVDGVSSVHHKDLRVH